MPSVSETSTPGGLLQTTGINTSKVSFFESLALVVMGLLQGLTETQPALTPGESHSVAAAGRKQRDLRAECLLLALAELYLRLNSQAAHKAELKEAVSSVETHRAAGIKTPVMQQGTK